MATLGELQTIYDAEDLYDMAELLVIDQHNRYVAQRAADREARSRQ
ncbi:hypothetical protein ACI01nite_26730 [Acetobacter cibinongensis]|uniref:Uncharacterized protein n=1 Tax=Acetobacter cibinongensis TaxID=146475 RepID=A0A0D6N6F3_9PROT|nr:hypothetical protein Abci_036_011 [Acetobacter cibinongensis]GBQ14452.1 hypothetical protein AA0482_0914 [Acetobacter cibinongensis NRIC 0482]GEL60071.1 hypothetical protein ACI01nite_26730 [Acetobacter cibinongensis]